MSETAPNETMLSIRNLETFYGPVMAIRGVSLDVMQGQIVAILGSNGAGKTTVLKTISGAMEPQKGSIVYNGQDITGHEPDRVARAGIGHVPEGREVFPFLSVQENLEMGAFSRRDRTAIAEDLEMVFDYFPDLRKSAKNEAAYLSGGQQQMLAIGRALMMRPHMMLLDEPSLGLSPKLVGEIFDIIRRLNSEQQMTILLVEQNAHMALQLADFGYVLEVGRVVMEGDRQRLLDSRDIQEFYLGRKEESARGKRRWKQRKTWR
ncbi:MAG: ABC transporter ATP-binding protein [Rhodobiaceae bacterium]